MFRPKFKKDAHRWKKALDKLRKLGIAETERLAFGASEKSNTEITDFVKKDCRELSSKSTHIKTVDDLIAYCEVDLEAYEVDRFVVNKWENFQSSEDGPDVVQLFQVKIWLKKRSSDAVSIMKSVHKRIMSEISQISPDVKIPEIRTKKNPILLEPFITDHHIAKICFEGDKVVWNKDKAIESYENAIAEIIDKAKGLNISRILLPTGNDLINIDSSKNTTFRDTPQMTGEQYHTIIADTEMLLLRTIKILSQIAPVDVVLIRGNHDWSSMFHVGRSIMAYFDNDDNVNVHHAAGGRQYYTWESVMIAMHHGHKIKANNMPQIMATEQPEMWGMCKYREAQLGHYHHEQSKTFSIKQDTYRLKGAMVRILDTLCPTDNWHKMQGFIGNEKRTQALAFSPESLEGIFYVNG